MRSLRITRPGRLSARELRWLAAALPALPAAALALRLRGLGPCLALFGRFVPRRGGVGRLAVTCGEFSEAAAIARIVRLAATYGPYRANCLPRAVVLWTLLRRRGLAPDIRIGVRRTGERLDAHAWVEIDGRPLDDNTAVEDRFSPLFGVPIAGRHP